jgi:phospho-N-acetylmuramoyl-pentapeptide-transferase
MLRALKAGQSILEIGPNWHNKKAGTPVMGGLMFIFAAILCLVGNLFVMQDYTVFFALALGLCFGLIGFLDDFCKIKYKRNLGLTALQKAMLQMAVSALYVYLLYRQGTLSSNIYVPFFNVST